MIEGFIKNLVILSVILLISGCSIIPNKDPDVIITTEPMLTKSEEGEVDMITSAESINLDSTGEKGYTLGINIIYFDYDKYSVEKKEDKAIIKKYSNVFISIYIYLYLIYLYYVYYLYYIYLYLLCDRLYYYHLIEEY